MTVLVQGIPHETGCYIDGWWGQYVPDELGRFAARLGYEGVQPAKMRRLAQLCEQNNISGQADYWWECFHESADRVLGWLNEQTEGGYWDWQDGEIFLFDNDDAEVDK